MSDRLSPSELDKYLESIGGWSLEHAMERAVALQRPVIWPWWRYTKGGVINLESGELRKCFSGEQPEPYAEELNRAYWEAKGAADAGHD